MFLFVDLDISKVILGCVNLDSNFSLKCFLAWWGTSSTSYIVWCDVSFHRVAASNQNTIAHNNLICLIPARSDELKATVLELPYQNNMASMFLFLPDAVTGGSCTNTEPIDCLIHRLTVDNLQNALDSLVLRHVNITMPKFKLKQTIRSSRFLTVCIWIFTQYIKVEPTKHSLAFRHMEVR